MTAALPAKPPKKTRAQEILRPVQPAFVVLTFAAALLLSLLPWSGSALLLKPDFTALVLFYWCVHQPRRVGFTVACLLGLVMDVADGTLLGQHALAYSCLAYAALFIHRRMPMLSAVQQVLYVLGALLGAQLILLLVRLAAGAEFIGWIYFAGAFTGAALWPALGSLFPLHQKPREAGRS